MAAAYVLQLHKVLHQRLNKIHGQSICLLESSSKSNPLRSVGRSRDVTTSSGPVDVDVLALWILLAGVLWLDPEGVGTKVITLGLEKVGWEVLGPVAVVERQGSAESRGWDTPESTLADNVSPALLCVVNGLVEEVVKEEVLEVWV